MSEQDRRAKVAELMKQGLGHTRISKATGLSERVVRNEMIAIRAAAQAGQLGTDPVMPGFEIASVSTQLGALGEKQREWIRQREQREADAFEAPAGHRVKGVSALVGPDGRVVQKWVKTHENQADPLAVVDLLKERLDGYAPAVTGIPVQGPEAFADDLLTLMPVNDWHVGMYAWRREAGESWDLSIAKERLLETVVSVINMSPPSAECVILVGGDLLHADNFESRTAKSGNVLDVDGRYAKVLETACQLMVDTTVVALSAHGRVRLRILRGNHDDHSALAVAMYLAAWFRDEPRVVVDTDPGLFWWYRWGSVLLGSTHGHTVKPEQMAQIMAVRRAEDWGATRHRYVHTFHLHHKRLYASEEGGVITEVHQAPIPQDAWHYGAGFLSGRSMQAITYHADLGEIARARVALGATSGSRDP